MKLRKLLMVIGVLAAAALAADQAKTYKVVLPAGRIGTTQIEAGSYAIAVEADAVKFTEQKTGKQFSVAGKVETLATKTPADQVHFQKVDGTTQISEIRPGGSKIRIDLRQPANP